MKLSEESIDEILAELEELEIREDYDIVSSRYLEEIQNKISISLSHYKREYIGIELVKA